ncbi:RNA dependent RNA polymerase-domain-containing protein [Rhodofomes roseus]|uniref:RNA dependent RNA polymerase-domain-containing protein n=1 Tax=Rhodofomes roseus TaxID=34475 RepID=A0ABQ8K870_9APHY|nr:RNA dependent RNA polymerase-domain-containing protein [Rhodofomes roseus]KAH9833398.1 RNA dependent RNA polymerase-domain-containing protein [Rhodofomes roseus]
MCLVEELLWRSMGFTGGIRLCVPSCEGGASPALNTLKKAPILKRRTNTHLSFTPDAIKLDMILFPANRILNADDPSKFILASFEGLRFPDTPASTTREYMMRLFKAGLFLNGAQYRFHGHSNSQLRSRSCFLRQADTDGELDARIYSFGEFERIMNAAKRAKRIGLLFSKADLDWVLDPVWTKDIDDIIVNGETFSDGCGLMSKRFAVQLSRRKRIIFHGRPYTPCGVLMLHPEMPAEHHAQFRASQKKFTATQDNTFSMVDHSVPYAFGRLNNDIIVLLASLGITSETLLAKQEAYHKWLTAASTDWEVAFNFLCSLGRYELAEQLLLQGVDDNKVQKQIRSCQMSELAAFKKNEKFRSRMVVLKSRLLFGVCDPYGVLREGEVFVRVSVPRKGASTLTNTDVLVVRNPCLHPGDCLKLRAVDNPRLSHLVDCVVFASRGKRAAPSMSSGGDLDGDRFLVMWDPDLVPRKVAESYTYPAPKERITNTITREDLARHFASYNTMTLARITALHAKWVRCSPKGAMSDECQDLNALHSFAVDGAPVKIPDRLKTPPEPKEPYIIDLLQAAARQFFDDFTQRHPEALEMSSLSPDDANEVLAKFLSTEKAAMSEYEVVTMAAAFARRNAVEMRPHLSHIDFGALTSAEKHAISVQLNLTPDRDPYIWNSLIRSEILRPRDIANRNLGGPLRLQRLYVSTEQGRAAFFEYLREATQQYKRRLLILKTDDRFSMGIFLRGEIPWDEEPEINDNVLVCPFMPVTSEMTSTYWRGTKGYKLHCSESMLQLYDNNRANTFIFVTRPPEKSGSDIVTSVALQKISGRVQKQYGRMYRTPVVTIEIHVVSNRDRVAHQAFDLHFEQVPTEEFLKRFDNIPTAFTPNTIHDIQWEDDTLGATIFSATKEHASTLLAGLEVDLLCKYLRIAIEHRVEAQIFYVFEALLDKEELPFAEIGECMEQYPSLAYCILKRHLSNGPALLPEAIAELGPSLIRGIVRSANQLGIASLAALERLAPDIGLLDLATYLDTLWWIALSVRAPTVMQELLLIMHESRTSVRSRSPDMEYAHKFALGVAFDRAEEAADACPCDDTGRPKRQRTAPIRATLVPPKPPQSQNEDDTVVVVDNALDLKHVVAHVRVDAQTPIRIHSHVRLRLASPVEGPRVEAGGVMLDATVTRATRGELYLELKHPLPPEYARVDWYIYNAGSIATSKAMMDAVSKLALDGGQACMFADIITGSAREIQSEDEDEGREATVVQNISASLNASQRAALLAAGPDKLALIWGPPGTGKTTVVVQILARFIREDPEAKILMTASTHNAVDNVLERFIADNEVSRLLPQERILRVATESSKVNKSLQKYTLDARIGGSINDDHNLVKKAEKRVREARIVFTTCSGAGLGVLRSIDFDTVLIDEASQISEPVALIPLVKGCRRAVLVGDHVQLRPTVRPMGKALEFDKSLFERLYTGPLYSRMTRTMLDVCFYFQISTRTQRTDEISSRLGASTFPWPQHDRDGRLFPVVFVPCASEEDFGRASKGNTGQAQLVKHILALLRAPRDDSERSAALVRDVSIAVLTPYSRQATLLKQELPQSVGAVVSTIDGFQGREADVCVLSTVRANMEGDIGFVEDARRLNVAWTRPKLGLIVIGSRTTLEANSALWKRALTACKEVVIALPEVE